MSLEHGAEAFAIAMVKEPGEPLYGIELLVYEELKRVLQARSVARGGDDTLQPREIVAVAFTQFFPAKRPVESHLWFYVVAAGCMRRLLVEGATAVLSESRHAHAGSAALLKMNTWLDRLQAHQPKGVRIMELHYFAGRTMEEIAALLNMSNRSVTAEFRFAHACIMAAADSECDNGTSA